MFQAYEYFTTIAPDVPEIKKVYRVSGISALEEVLTDVRNNPDCCLVVRDSGDGFLDLKDKKLDDAYHTLYIMVESKLNDHDSRMLAKRMAMATGIKLFERMKEDAVEFGQPAFGLNDSKIQYNEIGPIGGRYYYGYTFGYSMNNYF